MRYGLKEGLLGPGARLIDLLLLFTWISFVRSFNLDLPSKIVYTSSPSSLFGFSLVGHIEDNQSWIIVGAPEDESHLQSKLGIRRPGSVYKCQTRLPFDCEQIPFDTMGNNNVSGTTIDEKSRQWFGASLHSSGENGILVACAPRYVYFSLNKQRREPVGTCYTATDSFSKFSEYSPCRTVAWGFHQQGYCQAGFSSAISEDRLFIGAVGAYYAQGQVFSQNLKNRLDYFASQEGPENQDDSYLGYSLATGDFTGTNSVDLAVGVPRGANFTGKVVLYTGRRLFNLHNLTGNQVGAYFGYSLATFDGNGDGLDDLAIGAPLQSSGMVGELSDRYETGRVYVVYQNAAHKFRHWDILDGSEAGGRFGLSLSNLGDINLDGFSDLAIGSPYTESSRGSVFIYLGSPSGISKSPNQVIRGSSLGIHFPRGFGFSVAGGLDLDGNGYPDLIAGAPDSDQVYYFRSRPVVRVSAEVLFEAPGGKIQGETRNCSLGSGLRVACTFIKACLEYSGRGVSSEVDFMVTLTLDYKKANNYRMFFLDQEHSRSHKEVFRLQRKKTACMRSQIYLLPEVIDKLSPIEASLSYEIIPQGALQDGPLRPILDPRDVSNKVTDRVVIQKDCGVDNICVPDLRISYKISSSSYLIGSEEGLELDILVQNAGEASYETTFYLSLPPQVFYKRMRMLEVPSVSGSSPKILCSPPTASNSYTLTCDLGNPLGPSVSHRFRVVLKPSLERGGSISSLDLGLSVNSSNPEDPSTRGDNDLRLRVPVIIETELKVRGRSEPEPLSFNVSAYEESLTSGIRDDLSSLEENLIGPEVSHVYQVENKGPSDILAADVYILWPSFRRVEDEPLLYLTAQPLIRGRVSCDFVEDVNPFGIQVQKHTSHTSESFRYSRSPQDEDGEGENEAGDGGSSSRNDSLAAALDCGPSKCTIIHCRLGPLVKREFALFRLRSRLWSSTLSELALTSGQRDFEISSKLLAVVTQLPYGVDPSFLGIESLRITTHILASPGGTEALPIPAWILILSALAGLTLIALLAGALHKLGFFTRKRPYGGVNPGVASSIPGGGEEDPGEAAPLAGHKFQPGDIVL